MKEVIKRLSPALNLERTNLGCISYLFPDLSYKANLTSEDIAALVSHKKRMVEAFIQCVKAEQYFLYYSAPINEMNENSDNEMWKVETTINTVKQISDSADYVLCSGADDFASLVAVYGDYSDAESITPKTGNILFYFFADNYCDLK